MIITTSSFPRKKASPYQGYPFSSGSSVKRDYTNLYSWMDKTSLKHLCKLKPRPPDPNPSARKPRMLYTNQKSAHVILSFTWKKEKNR